jgi:hypothetical protein
LGGWFITQSQEVNDKASVLIRNGLLKVKLILFLKIKGECEP